MKALSPRQKKLLSFIRAHVKAHGFPPSIDEMRVALGYKFKSYTHHMVGALIDAGYLKRTPRAARGLQLVQTEDYHLPNCNCGRCAHARYLGQLRLVQSLQVLPPVAILRVRPTNFRALSDLDRLHWKSGFPKGPAPRTRKVAVPSGGAA